MLPKKVRAYLKSLKWMLNQEQIENNLIAQQIVDTNKAAFLQYKNMYAGKKVAVVATGPTLEKYVPEEDIVYIGVNKAYKYDKIKLDYLFCQDYLNAVPKPILEEINNLDCVKFYGKFKTVKDITIPETYISAHDVHPYFVDDCPPTRKLHEDMAYFQVMNCFSVVFAAIQFAIYTNPSEIYLIGCDCSSGGYFYQKGHKNAVMDKHLHDIYEGYELIKEFVEKHYPDTKIISVNPVGLKGMFEDRYTEEN